MQAYDLIMLIVIGMSTIFGAIKGFSWQVASLASIVISYIVAYRFRFDVAEMIQAKPPWNGFLAMLILFVGSSFVIWVGFRLLSNTIDRVRLKEFDRHLGAAFGMVKGLVYCLLITMFATSLLGPNQQAAICHSRSGYYIAKALDSSVGILPKEIHDVVGPYLARLDDKLKSGGAFGAATASDTTESTWPTGDLTGGIPSLENLPPGIQTGIQTSIQNGLQNGLQNALPQFLPGAGNSGTNNTNSAPAWPADWNTSSLNPSSSYPQAQPQIYPPLSTGGLRPASPQQAQQPSGAVLPR